MHSVRKHCQVRRRSRTAPKGAGLGAGLQRSTGCATPSTIFWFAAAHDGCGKDCARFPMPAIAARHPCAPSVICATSVAKQVSQNVSTALSVCRRRRRIGLGDAAFPVDLWAGARVCRRRHAPHRGLHRSKDAGVRPGFAVVPRAIDEGKRRRGLRARSHVGRSQPWGSPTRADPHHPERTRAVESPHDQFLA